MILATYFALAYKGSAACLHRSTGSRRQTQGTSITSTFVSWRGAAAKSFHEKAGASQDGFVFTCMGSLPLSQAASVAILLSALFVSDVRSVPVGCSRFSRCCYL
jgi:hypothetical protein